MMFFKIFLGIFYKKFTHFNGLNEKILCKISTKINKKRLNLIYGDWFLVKLDIFPEIY
jgi:translation initiation factor IF-1